MTVIAVVIVAMNFQVASTAKVDITPFSLPIFDLILYDVPLLISDGEMQ